MAIPFIPIAMSIFSNRKMILYGAIGLVVLVVSAKAAGFVKAKYNLERELEHYKTYTSELESALEIAEFQKMQAEEAAEIARQHQTDAEAQARRLRSARDRIVRAGGENEVVSPSLRSTLSELRRLQRDED